MDNNGLFRQNSLDKISSPEQLNDYISVTSPGIWMLLSGIVLVLVGALVWCTFGKLETRIKVPAVVNGGTAVLYVEAEDISKIKEGQKVELDKYGGSVTSVGINGEKAYEVLSDIALTEYGYTAVDILYSVESEVSAPDGVYPADIVIDSVSPSAFLLNNDEKY